MAILLPLLKCKHYPLVVDLYIEVNDGSNSINVRLWHKEKHAAINEELERIKWEFMFEGQTIDQCYGTFLKVTNNLVEYYVPKTMT